MNLLTDVEARIEQAHDMSGASFVLPWPSFAEFFRSRIYDPGLVNRNCLTYYDDDRNVCRAYTYAEFGALVEHTAAFLHHRLGLMRGDRLATVLFNHDLTVLLYFAAWTSGIAVVPINAEEPAERKRYILDHSEATAVVCWRDYYDEFVSLQRDLPALREVVALGDDGFLEGKRHGIKGRLPEQADVPRLAAHPPRLDDEALIIYTSGTTGPPKGVILTACNLLIDADAIAAWHGFGPPTGSCVSFRSTT